MANNWHEMTARPTGKRLDTAGTIYTVGFGVPNYSDGGERPFATVQPGKGLTTTDNVGGGTFMSPAVHPSEYAREFGREPGPEWTVNGKPFAGYVRLYTAAPDVPESDHRYTDRVHVEWPSLSHVTDAGRRAIEEWLTSAEVMAEVFSPLNVAEARDAQAASALYYADRDADAARAALGAAEEQQRAALSAAVAASRALDAARAAESA